MLQKYIGRTVEIIYPDRIGNFTKRRIQIHSIRDGRVKAFCATTRAPRVFVIENIMAVQPVEMKGVS